MHISSLQAIVGLGSIYVFFAVTRNAAPVPFKLIALAIITTAAAVLLQRSPQAAS
jgi:hypothetical protein